MMHRGAVPVMTEQPWIFGDGAATIGAAVLGALVVVIGYLVQQAAARHERRAAIYSEAIRAVEDYLEAPFIVLRRERNNAAIREITTRISDIQSRIAYYEAMLRVYAPEDVALIYMRFVAAARREAGTAMTDAWKSAPIRRGEQVPIGHRFDRSGSNDALTRLVTAMR
jgi:hypothetical protein